MKEKKKRIAGEKKVMQEIRQESTNMQNDIKKEHEMRQQRMQDLDDQMTQDTNLTSKFLDNFNQNASTAANTFLIFVQYHDRLCKSVCFRDPSEQRSVHLRQVQIYEDEIQDLSLFGCTYVLASQRGSA